jgi:hypothetical protein
VKQQGPALLKALRATLKSDETDYCPDLTEPDPSNEAAPTVTRLTDTRLLVATRCWSGAYNVGHGYWIVNQAPPYQPVLVTTQAWNMERAPSPPPRKAAAWGIAGRWRNERGRQGLVLAHATSTGMCRLIAPGGAWDLPTRGAGWGE